MFDLLYQFFSSPLTLAAGLGLAIVLGLIGLIVKASARKSDLRSMPASIGDGGAGAGEAATRGASKEGARTAGSQNPLVVLWGFIVSLSAVVGLLGGILQFGQFMGWLPERLGSAAASEAPTGPETPENTAP